MTPFADIVLLAALTLVSPPDGATVPLLRPEQKAYLAPDRAERFKVLDDPIARNRLLRTGHVQPPVRLEWQTDDGRLHPVILRIAKVGSDDRQTFVITNALKAYVTNLEVGEAYRWSVRRAGEFDEISATFETEPAAPRLMRVDGLVNVRDLGGWKARGGVRVRQGMIYRSSGLRGSASNRDKSIFSTRFEEGGRDVTDAGLAVLRDDMKIKTDIELRGQMETVFMNSSIIGTNVVWVKEAFSAYNFIDNLIRGREPFAKLFRVFVNAKSYPVLFHCAGGRDRTGTLAFLLLGLLGVSDEDLCRDWETSIFSEESAEFGSARIGRLLGYLSTMGGANYAEDCEIFARSCGITDAEIAAFRAIMLEKRGDAQ